MIPQTSPQTAPRRDRATASKIAARLARAIPIPRVELDHESPWQLLVATILSARVPDATVNRVTPELFSRFPTPAALAAAPLPAIERIVRPTGFFHNKARAVRDASKMLVERFGGRVPRTVEEICELPGVARKTANLVLGAGYGLSTGIAVDTHVARVAQRLALTRVTEPDEIERELCALVPARGWVAFGLRLLLHGRYVCTARAPRCAECPLNELCPSAQAPPAGTWTARADREAEQIQAPR